MCRVSVVIPVRNREKHIQSCVNSVLAQTYQSFEIIIVDDGSSDSTALVVDHLAQKDKRIHLLRHASSRGAQAARNTGIQVAKGEWIAFLDSDDQWLPDGLEVRLQLAMQKQLQVVHTECYVLKPERTELRLFGVPQMQGNVYKELLRRPGPMFQGLLVTKSAINRVGLLDETIVAYQEWDTAIRLAKYYQFGFIAKPTFLYDCRHADTISKDSLRNAKGYEQVIAKHFWPIFRNLAPRTMSLHYQRAADLYQMGKDQDRARRCSTKAFLLWPLQPKTLMRGIQRVLGSGC